MNDNTKYKNNVFDDSIEAYEKVLKQGIDEAIKEGKPLYIRINCKENINCKDNIKQKEEN